MEEVTILGAKCVLEFGFYSNNTIAITAYRVSDSEPWCGPTINWEENFQGTNYAKKFQFPVVIIKNYSENEGVYQDLIASRVIQHGVYLSGSGGTVLAAILTDKWKAIAAEQLKR
jgi:hypothetical protein